MTQTYFNGTMVKNPRMAAVDDAQAGMDALMELHRELVPLVAADPEAWGPLGAGWVDAFIDASVRLRDLHERAREVPNLLPVGAVDGYVENEDYDRARTVFVFPAGIGRPAVLRACAAAGIGDHWDRCTHDYDCCGQWRQRGWTVRKVRGVDEIRVTLRYARDV